MKLYLISRWPRLGLASLQADRGARYFETIREVADAWKTLNDEMVRIEDVAANDPTLGAVLSSLQVQLNGDQFIDFSLMIRLVVEALNRFDGGALRAVRDLRHLMVDEYQDVNPAQEALIRELRRNCTTLFVVGDDDQSIYAWRGADVTNILSFQDQDRYPESSSRTLSHNFRSTPAIVEAADRFAAAELGPDRYPKNPTADIPPGPRDFRNLWFPRREGEAEWVASRIAALLGTAYQEKSGRVRGLTPGDFAILMRSTRQQEGEDESPRHDPFTRALTNREIAYTLEAGGGVFDRPQVSALRDSFELLRNGPPDRPTARTHFNTNVTPAFPNANFQSFVRVMAAWGRLIHTPPGGARRRVFPQQLVYDLLNAFRIQESNFDPGIMRGLGIFSKMIQDVEAVYLSIDSVGRFREILNFLQNVAESGYDISTDDVIRRPDVVTVSTVHKMKGLEFPVVFVVDVEAQRFPKNRRSYKGWLPSAVIQAALGRGAYQSTGAEEVRLFYTAITRAERYLYVSGSEQLPGGKSRRKRSPFALRLNHPEISSDPGLLPAGVTPRPGSPRIDEIIVPTTYSDIRYFVSCPRDYQLRKSFGFSPLIPEMFGFGKTVHTAVGKLHEVFTETPPSGDEAEQLAREIFHLKHVPRSRNPDSPGPYENARNKAGEIARAYVETFGDDFACERQVEARFEVPVEHAVISGSIDLLLKEDEAGEILDATVVDFKAMEGGEVPEENENLHWTELSLQVQLYAKAAREVLGENAQTGAVHLLKDNQRILIPVTPAAVQAAVANVEWAVERIIASDFPMRPHQEKCNACDWKDICPKTPQEFQVPVSPPPIHIPRPPGSSDTQHVRAFSEFEG